jgi:hypothetical protein
MWSQSFLALLLLGSGIHASFPNNVRYVTELQVSDLEVRHGPPHDVVPYGAVERRASPAPLIPVVKDRPVSETEKSYNENMAHFATTGDCRYYYEHDFDDGQVANCKKFCFGDKDPGGNAYGCQGINHNDTHIIYDFTDFRGKHWGLGACTCSIPIANALAEIVMDGLIQAFKAIEMILNVACRILLEILQKVVDIGLSAIPGGKAVSEAGKVAQKAVEAAKTIYENGMDAAGFSSWGKAICPSTPFDDILDKVFDPLSAVVDEIAPGLGCKQKDKKKCRDPPKNKDPSKEPPKDKEPPKEPPKDTGKPDGPSKTDEPEPPKTTDDKENCEKKTKASDCVVTCTPTEVANKATVTCDKPDCTATRDACQPGKTETVTATERCGGKPGQAACPICTPWPIAPKNLAEAESDEDNNGLSAEEKRDNIAGRMRRALLEPRAEKVIDAFAAKSPNECKLPTFGDNKLRIPTYDSGGDVMRKDLRGSLNPDLDKNVDRWYTTTVNPAACTPDVVKQVAKDYNGGTPLSGKGAANNPQRPSLDQYVFPKSCPRVCC